MHRILTMAVLALALHVGTPATADQIAWEDLVDQAAQDFDDPYLDLTYEQIEDLRTIVEERARLENAALAAAERDASVDKMAEARARLAADGVDADWLLDQRWIVAENRKRAATAVNPNVNGRIVTVAGFAIPAPPHADGTAVVYLVPERGMCSHMPPPNPNQMIRARVSGDWTPSMMHEPVRLTGRLSAEDTQHVFRIVDGDVPMRASYVMDVSTVETMKDLYSEVQATNDWAADLAARLRASGQLKSQQSDTGK